MGRFVFLARLPTMLARTPIHDPPTVSQAKPGGAGEAPVPPSARRSGTLRRPQCCFEEANSWPTDVVRFIPLAEDRDPFSAPRSRIQTRPGREGPRSLRFPHTNGALSPPGGWNLGWVRWGVSDGRS